jgi:hypothetical protein
MVMASIRIKQLHCSFITEVKHHEAIAIKGGIFGLFNPEQFPLLEAVKGTRVTDEIITDPLKALDDDKFVVIDESFIPPVVKIPSTPSYKPPGRIF